MRPSALTVLWPGVLDDTLKPFLSMNLPKFSAKSKAPFALGVVRMACENDGAGRVLGPSPRARALNGAVRACRWSPRLAQPSRPS